MSTRSAESPVLPAAGSASTGPIASRFSRLLWVGAALWTALVLLLRPVSWLVGDVTESGLGGAEVLLTVPVGVAAIVFLRLMVGLDAFGLFSPLLMVLALRQLDPWFAMPLFVGVLLVMVPVRLLLERWPLLNVARTAVIICLTALVFLVAWRLRLAVGESGRLGFSLFIMAGSIERFVSAQMDQSVQEARKQSVHTLLVVLAAYALLSSTVFAAALASFPDLVALMPVVVLLLGRYTGLRWTERFRFRAITSGRTP